MADVTETRQGISASERRAHSMGLVPIYCEDPGADLARPVAIGNGLRVGRDEELPLALDDSQASRHHAALEMSGDALVLSDLGSRNGTWVDGHRITGRVAVQAGSILRCGKTLLMVVEAVEPYLRLQPGALGGLVGGPQMGAIRDLIETMAPLAEPVLIQGETGTGKERIAEALHAASGRTGALVPLNCAAIPKDLVEAELFGHSRGAFSGSDRARAGLFRAADGGTLLLDELGDLPMPVQAKLLRVLESGEVRPVGEDHPVFVSVRVVAATNLNLDDLVSAGRFRADLLHRIAAWRIDVPPLRERRSDIPALAAHFLPPGAPGFSVEAMEELLAWHFPGNVRELVNVVRTGAARAQAARAPNISPEHIPNNVPERRGASPPPTAAAQADVLRARIETALRLREGNVAQVARDLGVGRPALYQTLKRLGIEPSAYRKV